MEWRTSSYSGTNGQCVSVAQDLDAVYIRDTKSPRDPWLKLNSDTWARFIREVKDGRVNP